MDVTKKDFETGCEFSRSIAQAEFKISGADVLKVANLIIWYGKLMNSWNDELKTKEALASTPEPKTVIAENSGTPPATTRKSK